jgi:hypothetical protein
MVVIYSMAATNVLMSIVAAVAIDLGIGNRETSFPYGYGIMLGALSLIGSVSLCAVVIVLRRRMGAWPCIASFLTILVWIALYYVLFADQPSIWAPKYVP